MINETHFTIPKVIKKYSFINEELQIHSIFVVCKVNRCYSFTQQVSTWSGLLVLYKHSKPILQISSQAPT